MDIIRSYGGVYLDTDVELLADNPLEPYLNYQTVLCFENGRRINTGLFFAAEKGSEICKLLLEPYNSLSFSKETMTVNTEMNDPVFRSAFPDLRIDGTTQVFGSSYIMGCEEYGELMKHYSTKSWCEDLPQYTLSKPNWLKSMMRKPEIFRKLEGNRFGRKILPLYTFLAYDLQDLGIGFFIKLNWNKLVRKVKKVK